MSLLRAYIILRPVVVHGKEIELYCWGMQQDISYNQRYLWSETGTETAPVSIVRRQRGFKREAGAETGDKQQNISLSDARHFIEAECFRPTMQGYGAASFLDHCCDTTDFPATRCPCVVYRMVRL